MLHSRPALRGAIVCHLGQSSKVRAWRAVGVVLLIKTLATLMLLSLLAVGCDSHYTPPKRTVAEFHLLTTNMTLRQIIDRVGIYDRVRGSGIVDYEYDFPDGSAVLVCPDLSSAAKANPTVSITFYHSTNDIHLYP